MGIQLSHSALDKYLESPRKYFLHYLLRLRPTTVGSALPFGSSVDDAQGVLLKTKSLSKALDAFEGSFQSSVINKKKVQLATTDKVKWSKTDFDADILTDDDKKEIEKGANKSWISLKRKGHLLLEAYNDQVMPHLDEVIAVQKYGKIENGHGDKIVCYIDLIAKWKLDPKVPHADLTLDQYDGSIILIDNKTASNKYKSRAVEESQQLAIYREIPTDEYKIDYEGYIVLPKTIRKRKLPKVPIQIMFGNVEDETVDEVFENFEKTVEGIKTGQFPCTGGCQKTPWGCCYRRWCETDGEDMTGLEYVK